jgi:hypothetical protein
MRSTGGKTKRLNLHIKGIIRTGKTWRSAEDSSHIVLHLQIIHGRTGMEDCDRRQTPRYISRVDHVRKIRSRKARTDKRKYSFVKRTVQFWN